MTVSLFRSLALAAGLLACAGANAQGFSALITPPRFEDSAQPGTTYRNVIEISNVSDQRARFALRTADWTLDANAAAQFSDALAPGSCRPWAGIEAPEIVLAPGAKRRYRFEVAVPADAPAGECRFAVMIEGDPSTAPGAVAVPVAGRIAVIVYLAIGDAAAKLDVVGSRAQTVDDRSVPVLEVRNSGNAHGRLDGLVEGRDASGRSYAFAPSNQPILPGETRSIALMPQADSDDAPTPTLAYPVTLKGRLDWGAQRVEVDTTVTQ